MILPEVKTFKHNVFKDKRGSLWTIWKNKNFFNIKLKFNHDKVSASKKNVLRGIHGDNKSWKLITCLYGKIFFVVVDNRKQSKNYLKFMSTTLKDTDYKSILIPPNFGNGHLVMSDYAVFYYKWSYPGVYPDADKQFTIKWNDERLNIKWPIKNPILQKRDK